MSDDDDFLEGAENESINPLPRAIGHHCYYHNMICKFHTGNQKFVDRVTKDYDSGLLRYLQAPKHDYDSYVNSYKGTFLGLSGYVGHELIRNNRHKIKTKELEGKYVVLCIGEDPDDPDYIVSLQYPERIEQIDLLLSCNELKRQPQYPIETEVVLVPSKTFSKHSMFKAWCSKMPWFTPVSVDDKTEELIRIFSKRWIILDPKGNVLQTEGEFIFHYYGAESYPFTNDRILEIQSQDARLLKGSHPFNLQALMGSHKRDYLLSYHMPTSKSVRVPIAELEGNMIGLLFLELCYYCSNVDFMLDFYERCRLVKDSGKDIHNFKIVLVHLPLNCDCRKRDDGHELVESFVRLKDSPWLLYLPFNDPVCRKLCRIFGWLDKVEDDEMITAKHVLALVGPHGEFVDCGLGAWNMFHFGPEAYPFTHEKALKIRKDELEALTLASYFTVSDVLRNKDGKEISISELVGRNVLVIFAAYCSFKCSGFLRRLKKLYDRNRGTDDQFEIVHVSLECTISSFEICARKAPWWMLHPFDKVRSFQLTRKMFEGKSYYVPGLAGFGQDGKFITKQQFVIDPQMIDECKFPFVKGNNLEEQILKDFEPRYNSRFFSRFSCPVYSD